MIDIADRLTLLDESVSKPFLVESAKQKWHLPAAFTWTIMETEGKPCVPAQTRAPGTRASEIREPQYCSICMTEIKPGTGKCGTHTRTFWRRTIYSFPPRPAWNHNPEQPLMQDYPMQEAVMPPHCRQCHSILPKDITDGLCYVCTYLDLGYSNQEPTWLQFSSPSYGNTQPPFAIASEPGSAAVILGDSSSSLPENMPICPDSSTSGFKANSVGEATNGATSPVLDDRRFTNDLGLDRRYVQEQNVPTICSYPDGQAVRIEYLAGCLI